MNILLLGEYSNVHATLADGLRKLGQDVTVVSNGDFWKNYPRDIDVSRRPGKLGGVMLMARLATLLPKLRGYDIVQLINPMFFELKAKRLFPIYRYLRRHNKKIILGAFGMDYYWVHENITRMPLRYSDFNIGNKVRTDSVAVRDREDWIGTDKEALNKYIAKDCDGIVTGLFEYQVTYQPLFPDKTVFIPFPIKCNNQPIEVCDHCGSPSQEKKQVLKLFIGISKNRSAYKGTDIMLTAAKAVKEKFPDKIELRIAEGVPFKKYVEMLHGADAICDQLYSYTPAMNALEAMNQGIIVIGGGEPENYEILDEKELRPIINVQPSYESVFQKIENLALHPEKIPELKRQSMEYIRRHHDYIKVAQKYLSLYKKTISIKK